LVEKHINKPSMTHRFPIKEIARQAGLGTATVDRVLNNRAHVATQTRHRVQAAIAELEAQEQQLVARGRRMFVDVVVEAPTRFSAQVRKASETSLGQIAEAVFRPRFLMQEVMTEAEVVAALARVRKRGSQGVILKARDVDPIREAVAETVAAGVPVVTLVTDLSTPARCAYVGIDNALAGETAAYLLAQMRPSAGGAVLATRSQEDFLGEAERFRAFQVAYAARRPMDRVLSVAGGAGLSWDTRKALVGTLQEADRIDAVYSMGGGNRAILEALDAVGQRPQHFLAHDLDDENAALLQDGWISLLLNHDLTLDMRHAFEAISAWHGLRPAAKTPVRLSDVQVITPYNLPSGHRRRPDDDG